MRYAKALVAVLGAVLMAVAAAMTDGRIGSDEWVQIAIAGATAASVWTAANVPSLPYAKTVIAVVLAVLNLLVAYISDGLTPAEWVNLAIAALTAAGVYVVPNRPASVVRPAP